MAATSRNLGLWFAEKEGFKPGMKEWRGDASYMDDESGDGVDGTGMGMPFIGLGESELDSQNWRD